MDLAEALKYLEDYKIVPVLDRSDRDIIEHPLDYQEKNDLIWVHETDIMPKQSEDNYSHVATPHQAGTEITKRITNNLLIKLFWIMRYVRTVKKLNAFCNLAISQNITRNIFYRHAV